MPTGRYTSVIERLKPGALKPGDIVHVDGRRLGRHDGIINYTIGQRRGLKVAGPEPLFVVRLDADRNEVVVGPRDCLRTEGLLLRDTNWLGDETLLHRRLARDCPCTSACDPRSRRSRRPFLHKADGTRHCCARGRRGWRRDGAGVRVLRGRGAARPACWVAASSPAPWRRAVARLKNAVAG